MEMPCGFLVDSRPRKDDSWPRKVVSWPIIDIFFVNRGYRLTILDSCYQYSYNWSWINFSGSWIIFSGSWINSKNHMGSTWHFHESTLIHDYFWVDSWHSAKNHMGTTWRWFMAMIHDNIGHIFVNHIWMQVKSQYINLEQICQKRKFAFLTDLF